MVANCSANAAEVKAESLLMKPSDNNTVIAERPASTGDLTYLLNNDAIVSPLSFNCSLNRRVTRSSLSARRRYLSAPLSTASLVGNTQALRLLSPEFAPVPGGVSITNLASVSQ